MYVCMYVCMYEKNVIEHNMVRKSIWHEAEQLAIWRCGSELNLGLPQTEASGQNVT